MARDRRVAALALGLHLVANATHGVPHTAIPVPLAPWQWAFVFGGIVLAPVAAFALLRRGRARAGASLFAVSMAASLAFGAYFHYATPNPDHVNAVPAGPWRGPFRATALLVVADALGVLVGAWLAIGLRRNSAPAEA